MAENSQSYLAQLKSRLTPEQYDALISPLTYTANDWYGGNVQDYQAQLITPLDTSKAKFPQQLPINPIIEVPDTYWDGEREIAGTHKIGGDFNADVGAYSVDASGNVDTYRSNTPVMVNGLPIYAIYDGSGKLTGYDSGVDKTTYLNGKQRLLGAWDATGKPLPQTINSQGGGFLKNTLSGVLQDPVLMAAITAAATYYGAGPIAESLSGLVGGAEGLAALPAASEGAAASDFLGALPAGSQYVAPAVTDLGTVAGTTEGMLAAPEIAGMGGAQGLQMPVGTNLAEMGGAQGLQSGVGTSWPKWAALKV